MNEKESLALATETAQSPPDRVASGLIRTLSTQEAEGALASPLGSPPAEEGFVASPVADAMVRLAREQAREGVAESPPHSNEGVPLDRYVRWFAASSGPEPWCAYFVSWCLDRVTDSNRRVPWAYPGSAGSIYQWAAANGRLAAPPAHGDIFGIGSDHCGIIAGANPDGTIIYTTEGNWEDKVAEVERRTTGLWFARIH